MDDVTIRSKTYEEHRASLSTFFERLRHADLTLEATRCYFFCEEVGYLGHTLSKKTILNYPHPKTISSLRRSLRMAQY